MSFSFGEKGIYLICNMPVEVFPAATGTFLAKRVFLGLCAFTRTAEVFPVATVTFFAKGRFSNMY